MAEISASGETYVEVGFCSMRDPATGGFLPRVPLFIKISPDEVDKGNGLASCEKELIGDIASVMAEQFAKYINGTRKEARRIVKEHT